MGTIHEELTPSIQKAYEGEFGKGDELRSGDCIAFGASDARFPNCSSLFCKLKIQKNYLAFRNRARRNAI